MDRGIYRGTKEYYAGELKNGQPVASGPGIWAGRWFKTKKMAIEYLDALENDPEWAANNPKWN